MDSLCLRAEPVPLGESASGRAADADLAASIGEAKLRRLHAYWVERKGNRPMPARRDIDPLDFPYLLGSIMLIDVVRDPLRFRVRLHGTALVRLLSYELTGKLLDELPNPDYRAYVIARCSGLVESGKPAIVHQDGALSGRWRKYEALWLPFADDGSAVTMLLCALVHANRRERPRSTVAI